MQQCDYSLFKYKIQPVWEEPENKEGGRIVFQVIFIITALKWLTFDCLVVETRPNVAQ